MTYTPKGFVGKLEYDDYGLVNGVAPAEEELRLTDVASIRAAMLAFGRIRFSSPAELQSTCDRIEDAAKAADTPLVGRVRILCQGRDMEKLEKSKERK